MKRIGYLYDSIADIDNLWHAFVKAKRGRESKSSVNLFLKKSSQEIIKLHKMLVNEQVDVGTYHCFRIFEPKERVICAASFSDRVLHHAIMNVCHPYFESFQIFDSYATRIGKGQYAALNRAVLFSREYSWFCKLDVRKYFDSVDHALLLSFLGRRFKDERLLRLFKLIIQSYSTVNSKGLPIGNLTSQYFANFYLAHADHFIKETLKAKAYVRYMDDMVLWANNKVELKLLRDSLSGFIKENLNLELRPDCLNSIDKGLPFLGYVIYRNRITLSATSKKRFLRKMRICSSNLSREHWTQEEYSRHVLPLIAFTQYSDSKSLRIKCISTLEVD